VSLPLVLDKTTRVFLWALEMAAKNDDTDHQRGDLFAYDGRGVKALNYKLERSLSTPSTAVFVDNAAKLIIVASRGQWSRPDPQGAAYGLGDPDDTDEHMMEP
jgi:hypothetical protein